MIRVLVVAALVAGCGRELPSFTTAQLDSATLAADAVDASRLQAHVEAIVGERLLETPVFTTQRPDKPITHERSAVYIRTQLEQLGYTAVVESTTRDDGLVINNVYVDIPGATRPDEIILFTAHHDSYYAAGADDNASGVAALLEAARVLRTANLDRTVRIIGFDLEELILLGSRDYAERHASDNVVLVVNIDVIGFGYRTEATTHPAPPSTLHEEIGNDALVCIASSPATDAALRFVELSRALGEPRLDVVGMIGSAYPSGAAIGDQVAFWERGVPALGIGALTSFSSPGYHTDADLPETLDYDYFHRAARLIIGAVAAYARVE